ncbi:hypothetical protein PROAA_1060021 [Candidatus Propionivibrio aalborgensis]|uniref:Uncharacterized protein n=1 Tax=Candidatus Propionivibrio aalborgensis TaxID=1860101 RepID=A0A1A8XE32_9RHOO|nr:hypothetical protein PROAA_1060021 [Candidatus Propionivibrio aalborgensis]
MSRSKRQVGVARPHSSGASVSGGSSSPKAELIQSLVLFLLVLDVLPYHCLVAADCLYEVSASPEVLPDEIALALSIYPGQVNDAPVLDETNHPQYRILRRDRDHRAHVIGHQVSFHDLAFLLHSKLPVLFSQMLP